MQRSFRTYLLSFLVILAASAVVVSTVWPASDHAGISCLADCETDAEHEKENEPAKEDDVKEQFARWPHQLEPGEGIWCTRRFFKDQHTRLVHLDIFTPPPEC